MIDAGATVGVALVGGFAALFKRVHNRIDKFDEKVGKLDKKVGEVELAVAENYVSRTEHYRTLDRIEEHMVRIEGKLDLFIQQYTKI